MESADKSCELRVDRRQIEHGRRREVTQEDSHDLPEETLPIVVWAKITKLTVLKTTAKLSVSGDCSKVKERDARKIAQFKPGHFVFVVRDEVPEFAICRQTRSYAEVRDDA